MKNPTQCHLWNAPKLESRDLHEALEVVKRYVDESHLGRSLRCCKICGQLYFHEFREWVDWEDGEDPQRVTIIPVDCEADVEPLLKSDMEGLLDFSPRLVSDFPKGVQEPHVFWVGKLAEDAS